MLEIPNTLSLNLSKNDKWLAMLDRMDIFPSIFDDAFELKPGYTWAQFKEDTAKYSGVNMLLFVNTFWNKYEYIQEEEVDHWMSPYEFVNVQGGDCEDFAVVKYFTLLKLGVPEEDLGILVLRGNIDGEPHAVLLVRYEGSDYLLDNLKNGLTRLSELTRYTPVHLITGGKSVALLGRKASSIT